jgi:hypothetical protein
VRDLDGCSAWFVGVSLSIALGELFFRSLSIEHLVVVVLNKAQVINITQHRSTASTTFSLNTIKTSVSSEPGILYSSLILVVRQTSPRHPGHPRHPNSFVWCNNTTRYRKIFAFPVLNLDMYMLLPLCRYSHNKPNFILNTKLCC